MPVQTRRVTKWHANKRRKIEERVSDPDIQSVEVGTKRFTGFADEILFMIIHFYCTDGRAEGEGTNITIGTGRKAKKTFYSQVITPRLAGVSKKCRDAVVKAKYRELEVANFHGPGHRMLNIWMKQVGDDIFANIQRLRLTIALRWSYMSFNSTGIHAATSGSYFHAVVYLDTSPIAKVILNGGEEFSLVTQGVEDKKKRMEQDLTAYLQENVERDEVLNRNVFPRAVLSKVRAIFKKQQWI